MTDASNSGDLRCCSDGAPVSFAVCAVGVGQSFTCTVSDVISVRPPPMRSFMASCASGDFWSSRATGVPHMRTAASVNVTFTPSCAPPLAFASVAVGVGHGICQLIACVASGGSGSSPARFSRFAVELLR